MWNRFKTLDPLLYLLPIILMVISTVVIYTLTYNSVGTSLAVRQGIFSAIGLVLILFMTFVDYRSLKAWSGWIFIAGLIGLVLVKLVGKSEFGAQLWIDIGFFQLQPGEIEKLVVIVAVATLLHKGGAFLSGRRFGAVLAATFIPVVAIMAQPDLGTAIVILGAGIGMLLYAKKPRWQTAAILGGIVLVVTIFTLSLRNVAPFTHLLKEYQKDRLVSFIDPTRDSSDTGYHVEQSVIAVGSGGLTGKGLGFGSQSQLNFLPVVHSDFIFAGIAESWGLIGSWGIIGLYSLLMLRIIQAARIAKDDFGMFLCVGVMAKILIEVIVNVGMNIRLMPVTGIPLPFLSYGGTTMLTNALLIGIVQSVVIRYKRLTF